MNNIYRMLPKLVVNKRFMYDFINASTPCCALGVIEARDLQFGLIALRLNDIIPNEVLDRGFRFGHTLFGTSSFEVVPLLSSSTTLRRTMLLSILTPLRYRKC